MAADTDAAFGPLAPGPLLTLGDGALEVDIAPQAGGRIAQIRYRGIEQLIGYGEHDSTAMIAWGSYPMVPWAGRIRHGEFVFAGQRYSLPRNLGAHAIHGVGFALPWLVEASSARDAQLSLRLPEDQRWPFGGTARQHIEVQGHRLRMRLSVTAGTQAMPVSLGWHPWFRKPDAVDFAPTACYPRDADGIASLPLAAPPAGPWDDCFVNDAPVAIHRGGQAIRLSSDCTCWVVFDELAHATCIEPQSGPPDAFTLEPAALEPGRALARWYELAWD